MVQSEDSDPVQIIMISYFRPNDFMWSVRSIFANTLCPFHLSIIDNSHGGLDKELDELEIEIHERITIYRNDENIGKGLAFNQRYPGIIKNCPLPYFISIDSDIEVTTGWLGRLKDSYRVIAEYDKPGIIAPAISNNPSDTFGKQVMSGTLTAHILKDFEATEYKQGLYRNSSIGGALYVIDKQFFESVGGYREDKIYGDDDRKLYEQAFDRGLFVGIDSNVHVNHMNADSTEDYNKWKKRNSSRTVDRKGFWD